MGAPLNEISAHPKSSTNIKITFKSKNLFIEVEKQKYPILIQLEPLKRTNFKNL